MSEQATETRCPRCQAPRYEEEETCRYCAQSMLASESGRAALREGLLVTFAGLCTLVLGLYAAAGH